VHFGKILPLNRDRPREAVQGRGGSDPRPSPGRLRPAARSFIALTAGAGRSREARTVRRCPVEERLKARIVDGDAVGLEADLSEALRDPSAFGTSSTTVLLDGMKAVGDLFGERRHAAALRPAAVRGDDEGRGRATSSRSWRRSGPAARRARSCSRPYAATCTTSARTSSTSS
jgi:5-methyltetrahydrofolate--homocysteine methyltransferase